MAEPATGHTELHHVLSRILAGASPEQMESDALDFKEPTRGSAEETIAKIAKAAICFANTSGGNIVVGLDDDAHGPSAFIGCSLDPRYVQQRVYELTDPHLLVSTAVLRFADADLLVVGVPASFDIHADTQGRASRRIGKQCVPLSPKDQERLREERRGVDWSAQPSTLDVKAISTDAERWARQSLARASDERQGLADLSTTDLLRALGLVDRDGRLLRAGEVLLCHPAEPRAHVVYQYRPTPGGEASAVERLDGPLVLVFQRLVDLVWARRNVTPITLPGGVQVEVADFPENAVREAVANAVLHRDYRLESPVHVEHSPSAFVVTSPGPLVGGVTPSNILTHPSKPRNPRLTQAARLLRLAEETGRGVDRMFREMIRAGRDVPVIEDHIDSVRVALLGGAPRTQVARFVAQLPPQEREDTDTLLVLFTLCNRRTINSEEMAGIIQKHPAEAEAVLGRLSSDEVGILEPTRATRRLLRSQYRLRSEVVRSLGSAVRYQRRTADEIDRKVISHVREYGRVTNRTLQNLFDIDVYKARDILADLVQREFLVKTSVQARGPNVQYGPGPKFPAGSGGRRSGRRARNDG